MKISFTIILFCFFFDSYSQTEIELEPSNGIYLVACEVNDIPMKFVLDTGASNVSISSTEALFLIKQGKIDDEDFIGELNYKTASGEILEGTEIILRKIDMNGYVITNVKATIIHDLNAPLLLGQSALSKLGDYSIKGNKLIIQDNIKNKYEKEMFKAYKSIDKSISMLNIEKDSVRINYFFRKLYETPEAGYILVGKKKKITNKEKIEEVFFIALNEVTKVYFEQNTEYLNVENLVVEVNVNGNGILLMKPNSESMYKTYAYVIELHHFNELLKNRIIRALKKLLRNNKKYQSKTLH